MRHYLIFITLFYSFLVANGQIHTAWDEAYGGSADDEANNIVILSDGNILIAGYTESQGEGKKDGYLMKLNREGELIWETTYGGAKDDILFDVLELNNNKLAAVGYTESQGAGGRDYWLIVTDKDGTLLWEKTYGGQKDDEAIQVNVAKDGKLVITGNTKSRGAGSYDIWSIKIDQDGHGKDLGKELWKRNVGGNSADFAGEVIENKADSMQVIVGTTTSFGAGSGDVFVIKLSDDVGQMKGKKTLGGKLYDYGYGVQITTEKGYFIVGASLTNSNGLLDGWAIRINHEFDSYFVKNIGGKKDDAFKSVVQHNEHFLIAGHTESEGEGKADGWLVMLDKNGIELLNKTIGESGNDQFVKIINSPTGDYYLCGNTDSKGEGKKDIWVVKIKIDK